MVNYRRCGDYTHCRLRGIENIFPIAYITNVLDLFRASCVDSFKFKSFKLLEA